MKSTIINERNAARIEKMLGAANGRAVAHTVTFWGALAGLADDAEEQLAILPKKERVGAFAEVQPEIWLPNSYNYRVTTTRAKLVRRATGWALVEARKVEANHRQAKIVQVAPTGEQITEIIRRTVGVFDLRFAEQKVFVSDSGIEVIDEKETVAS